MTQSAFTTCDGGQEKQQKGQEQNAVLQDNVGKLMCNQQDSDMVTNSRFSGSNSDGIRFLDQCLPGLIMSCGSGADNNKAIKRDVWDGSNFQYDQIQGKADKGSDKSLEKAQFAEQLGKGIEDLYDATDESSFRSALESIGGTLGQIDRSRIGADRIHLNGDYKDIFQAVAQRYRLLGPSIKPAEDYSSLMIIPSALHDFVTDGAGLVGKDDPVKFQAFIYPNEAEGRFGHNVFKTKTNAGK